MTGCVFCELFAEFTKDPTSHPEIQWIGMNAIFEPLNPVVPGHRLVAPMEHVADVGKSRDITARVMKTVSQLAEGLDSCNIITSKGTDATQTVFHFHVHVVPRTKDDGLKLPWTGQKK